MASKQSIVDYIVEQIAGAGEVSSRKMFGEYAIYAGAKTVALVCDNKLFLKPTVGGRAFGTALEEGFPYPGAKPWLLIPEEKWDDHKWLTRLVQITASELPIPKVKTIPKKK